MANTRLQTPLCDLLHIEYPVIQAPIGSASVPALAAAVANAGGLGMLGLTWCPLAEMRTLLRTTRQLTDRPVGINLILEWNQMDRLRLALDEGVRIISLFWGNAEQYNRYIEIVHAAGALALVSVGSVQEARQAVAAGADVIVAQGWEAGGHVRGQVTTLVLTPAVVDAVAPVPVVAAGGIADGRGIAAALMLGASGVWLGTRFLASVEADVHAAYKQQVIEASESDTYHGTVYVGGWPNAPGRTLRNSTIRQWEAAGRPAVGQRPGEGEVVAHFANGKPVRRYDDTLPQVGMQGNLEALALYAGQSAGLIHTVLPAGEIVRTLVAETEQVLAGYR